MTLADYAMLFVFVCAIILVAGIVLINALCTSFDLIDTTDVDTHRDQLLAQGLRDSKWDGFHKLKGSK